MNTSGTIKFTYIYYFNDKNQINNSILMFALFDISISFR